MNFNQPIKLFFIVSIGFILGWFVASMQFVNRCTKDINPVFGDNSGRLLRTVLAGSNIQLKNSLSRTLSLKTTHLVKDIKESTSDSIFIFSRDTKNWNPSNIVCNNTSNFVRTELKTEAGNTPIFVHDPSVDRWVSGSLINNGEWEGPHVRLIFSLLKEDKDLQFLDLGTNLGVYALSVAKFGRKAIAVDALSLNIERLCASITVGNFQKSIKVVYNALSDVREVVSLGVDSGNIGGTFVAKDKNPNKVRGSNVAGNYGSVQTILLDDILDLPGFDFKKVVIKMDVEGYENRVFKGAENFFKHVNVNAVLMEWMWLKTGPAGQEIIDFFLRHNFEPTFPRLSRKPLLIHMRNVWPNDVLWRRK